MGILSIDEVVSMYVVGILSINEVVSMSINEVVRSV